MVELLLREVLLGVDFRPAELLALHDSSQWQLGLQESKPLGTRLALHGIILAAELRTHLGGRTAWLHWR